MRKSYRRHYKRPKRKNTRRRSRRGGDDGEEPNNPIIVEGNVRETVPGAVNIDEHYNKGYEEAERQHSMLSDLYNKGIQVPLQNTNDLAKNTMRTVKGYTDTVGVIVQPHVDSIRDFKDRQAAANLPTIEGINEARRNVNQYLQKKYEEGLLQGQKHIDDANKMAKDLHKQAKSGESAFKSIQPPYDKMKSSMGFSSLSTKTPNVEELQNAQKASSMGVPSAFSQRSNL